eukprot:g2214.t1
MPSSTAKSREKRFSKSVLPCELFLQIHEYEREVLYQHRLLTGVDVLYRDVLQLQRKLDVLEILLAAIQQFEDAAASCGTNGA